MKYYPEILVFFSLVLDSLNSGCQDSHAGRKNKLEPLGKPEGRLRESNPEKPCKSAIYLGLRWRKAGVFSECYPVWLRTAPAQDCQERKFLETETRELSETPQRMGIEKKRHPHPHPHPRFITTNSPVFSAARNYCTPPITIFKLSADLPAVTHNAIPPNSP